MGMGGASKLKMLLSSPFIIYHPTRPSSALRLLRVSASTLSSSSKPSLKFLSNNATIIHRPYLLSNSFHTHSSARDDYYISAPAPDRVSSHSHQHPWPEWSNFVDSLRANGYLDRQQVPQLNGEDALSVFENLPQHFLIAAAASLLFARERPHLLGSLSRRDIEVVVENGSPFLFQTAVDTARRMKAFLGNDQNNELAFERASMVDLMRFLLSYVYNPAVSDQNKLGSGEHVESSVRNLLSQLAYETRVVHNPSLASSEPKQFSDGYGQNSRPLRQNIEMKRGDWICSKCSFMNFARNMNCLECDEARPKRQLTGGEWNCPQCDFFNYGKNVACLRCDCKRPGEVSMPASPRFGFERNNENMANTFNTQRTNLEPRTTNAGTSGASVSRNLDRILGRTSEESKSDYVPFNPLPSDMFSRNQNSNAEEDKVTGRNNFPAATRNEPMSFDNPRDNLSLSRKPVNQTESKEDKEQAEKSEKWFKKVAELHDVTDLPSAISDEDFPEIMPMRQGENRFVVSKKKDRSLTSPPHKRRVAMEQTTNATNFVPFVPFPPDYFAKKNKVPETEASTIKDASGTSDSAAPKTLDVAAERNTGIPDSGTFSGSTQNSQNEQGRQESWGTSFSGNNSSESRVDYSYGRPSESSTQVSPNEQIRNESWGTSFRGKNSSENRVDYSYGRPSASSTVVPTDFRSGSRERQSEVSLDGSRSRATQQSENANNRDENWRAGFSGKSLEGSLVKEPDPLDMSEEAKAERWFRRVAQIKDISELSQIPDEDFPQIMPMRKGVNRFVVSKRKTPLERRLTSPQYRRNLPTVSSEPMEKENTES